MSQFCVSLFVNYCYITHFNGLAPIKSLPYLFSEGERIRYTFGLGVTNRAAYLAFTALVLSDMVLRSQGGYKLRTKFTLYRAYLMISVAVSILVILSTQTRGAVLAAAVYLLIAGKRFLKKRRGMRFILRWALPVGFIIYAVYVFGIAFNRSEYLTTNWNIFWEQGNHWLGMGYVPFSGFLNDVFNLGTAPMDCYYLYIICTTGIVGVILIFCPLMYLYRKFAGIIIRGKNMKKFFDEEFILAFFILLFISFSESLLIAPFVSYSYVYWIGFILVLMDHQWERKHGLTNYR